MDRRTPVDPSRLLAAQRAFDTILRGGSVIYGMVYDPSSDLRLRPRRVCPVFYGENTDGLGREIDPYGRPVRKEK